MIQSGSTTRKWALIHWNPIPGQDPEIRAKNCWQLYVSSSKHGNAAPSSSSPPQPEAQQMGNSLGEKGKLVQMKALPHRV